MMVYFCLSPRHHSSLLPVPLLSLCYNEERLQPELGLGVGEAGARDAPAALPFTPNPHPPWDADQGVRGQTQKMCLTFSCALLMRRNGGSRGSCQRVLGDLGRPVGEEGAPFPFFDSSLPGLHTT